MNYFKIIYQILRCMEQSMDSEIFNTDCISAQMLGISVARRNAILEILVQEGYVSGVAIQKIGELTSVNPQNAKITLKGLEYLEENAMMKKAYRLLKGAKEVTPFL
ncbi:MAG: YjcQ family protein [Peptostreptococcaceae bacterium]|nr:YjcQ family protein [Peptostreptococcaceae bacterium]